MYDIKMIVTDFDDTFYSLKPGGSWLADNTEALNEARHAGIAVYPCSGRPWPQAATLIAQFNFNNLCVTDNGAAIVNMESSEAIYQDCISSDAVKAVLLIAERYGLIAQLSSSKHIGAYVPYSINPEEYSRRTTASMNTNKYAFNLYHSIEEAYEDNKETCLLVRYVIESDAFSQSIEKDLSILTDVEFTWSHVTRMDIMANGVNKGAGLIKLAEMVGIDLENIMALGDAKNDASMLRLAGLGVAMGEATDITKEAADYISDLTENSGFAKAVRKFALGKKD